MRTIAWVMMGLLIGPAALQAQGQGSAPAQRLFYYATNLLVDRNVDDLAPVWRSAAAAGYTGVVLTDSKFGRLADMDRRYFANVERAKALAAELKLEVVPCVFPLGYSESILSRDPNLAEAMPVRDALFVVQAGKARLAADPPVALRGGDMANLGQWDFHDPSVVADGGAARVRDPAGNARLSQKLRVQPQRQYHVSVRIRTQDFRGEPEIKVLAAAPPTSLQWAHLGVKPTQDWTVHHAVFNSLGNTEVRLYLGVWGGARGALWWDDAAVEEVGLLNVVRRPGAPLSVKVEGGRELVEGRDFEPVSDPRMGTVPWKGSFEVYHEPPVLRLRPAAGLRDGSRLRVAYHHALTVHDGQVMICPSEPATVEVLRDQARRVHAAFGARAYFMSHDEIRVLNWDESCTRRGLDSGAILADNVRTCAGILREVNPGGRIYVWSDMFDPNHNAHKDYYLVRGDLAGSWEGLDQDVIVVPWYFDKRAESIRFFARRGHAMLLAGHYDTTGPALAANVRGWLDAARREAPGLGRGMMYTTWKHDYRDLEAFARLLEEGR